MLASDLPITVLHIGAQHTVIASGNAEVPDSTITLAIGSRMTGEKYFKHAPPTPAELEIAIMVVEDEVFRARNAIIEGSSLVTTDAAIRAIAVAAGVADQAELVLTCDVVEASFNRLADLASGRPASQDKLPTHAESAATLLILREFMHHLKFMSITVMP